MAKIVIDMPDLHDVNETCQILGIGYATLFRWIKKGKVIPVKVDRRTLIPTSEIERLKNNQATERSTPVT